MEDDDYNNQHENSTQWSEDDFTRCSKIKRLVECGMGDVQIAKFMSALENRHITMGNREFENLKFCNNTFLNEVMDSYFWCLENYIVSNSAFGNPIDM